MQALRAAPSKPDHKPRLKFRDPAPSKWDYKLQRLMLTRGVKTLFCLGLPTMIMVLIGAYWFGQEANQTWVRGQLSQVKAAIYQRPEFTVHRMVVTGADPQLQLDIATVLDYKYPLSSLSLDLERIRTQIEDLFAVKSARISLGQGGVLDVHVTPRVPAAIWRENNALRLVDQDGILSGMIEYRADRLDLPLVVGQGATDHMTEALALFAALKPQMERVRALVRVGNRRWDVLLDREQKILLPQDQPVLALERVMALHQGSDVLSRDVTHVDMRNMARPTIRINQGVSALRVGALNIE